jgi:outer membrane protein, multidrug efflux system
MFSATCHHETRRRQTRSVIWIISLISSLLLSGCAVGPNYKSPHIPVSGSFANTPTNHIRADETALLTWWRGFNDSTLDALVARAITNNHDLRIATANLKEARALYRFATFDFVPTVHANAGYDNHLLSQAAAPGFPRNAREGEFYDAGFDATWELDLFGRVRRSVQAASANVAGFEASRLDALVSVTSEVARNYFELRGLQHQLAVARRNAEVQTETLKLTQSLLDGGRGTEFDVSRSRALLNLTLSTIPTLEAAIQQTINRIAVLTGEQPTAFAPELSVAQPLPQTMPALPLTDPASLLRRRPDIRGAERSLAAATARIGVATADLFPRVTFIGSVGLQAESFSGLGKAGADTWNFGPRITWAALDLGRVRSRIKAADARAEASLALYERTVLVALEETESVLVEFGKEQARREFLRASSQASQQAANLARQRFEGGSADFLSVLDAERTLLEAQDRLAESEKRTITALVAVYKALGAGAPAPQAE